MLGLKQGMEFNEHPEYVLLNTKPAPGGETTELDDDGTEQQLPVSDYQGPGPHVDFTLH